MEERRELFDASAYMLFEAIGDSEAEYFDAAFQHESDVAAATAAEDDAQSCSYRSSRLHRGGDDFRGVEFDYYSVDEEEEEEEEEVDDDDGGGGSDEEDGVVDQCRRRRREAAAEAEAAKSKGFEESKAMMMNEREGDKLFWEACLAS